MKKEANRLYQKAIKFLIVGGIGTALNYVTFLLLFKLLNVHYIAASVIGYITGLILGYYLNKNWTYYAASSQNSEQKYICKYLTVYMLSLLASQILLKFLVEQKIFNELIANVFAIGLSTLTNFLGTNFIVFVVKEDS